MHKKASAPQAARSCVLFWLAALGLSAALCGVVNIVEAYLRMWGWF